MKSGEKCVLPLKSFQIRYHHKKNSYGGDTWSSKRRNIEGSQEYVQGYLIENVLSVEYLLNMDG